GGVRSEFRDNAIKAHAPVAFGDTANGIHKPLLALGRNGKAYLSFALSDAEPQKLPPERTVHRTLRLVHRQLQLRLQVAGYGSHHPLPCPLAPNVDIAVVGVPAECQPPTLQLLVQVIQKDVRQQRGERAALGSSLLP